jgi:adenosylcobinamide kinase/adenosylcobinamide-phosphate guanylyltransferase
MPAARIVFITGGARSGKSSFAISEALKIAGKKAFIATAEATDREMEERIKRHKQDRGNRWKTFEEPVAVARLVEEISVRYPVIVIDCLTLWLANVMMSGMNAEKEIRDLTAVLRALKKTKLFVVSNEVGMGIVPENELARKFRDMAGRLNQKVASASDEVYITLSGIPVKIKG